ncbi:MAG: YigZ family protein, partial [Bacteroidota bacterium]|nr:YigZ family protein [Bacteroidota bacterium]
MFDDNYREIKSPATGLYKEKGSKFIAYAFPVYSEVQAKKKLENVKKLEHSARHHCYAYVLHADKSAWRANDDGEPSSTAGKPILGQIQSNNLTNILIIVVRYFGGVKLGVSGLIRSYRTAVANAISQATIITK